MEYVNNSHPIIACSTGIVTNSAIAVIRISGFDYLGLINHLFNLDLETIIPRHAYFCKFIDHQQQILDEIVLTFFKGPHSYNGEDILELSVHGNQINIERIILEVLKIAPFERANPGEFTLRALNKGKLSLNQVEGLDLLLNASNIFSLDQGQSLLSGELNESFQLLHKVYIKHRSCVEFGFDFLDDIGEELFQKQLSESFSELKAIIEKLYSHVSNQNFSLIKPEIVLYGLPNAGKSTLFNLFLNSDRAITSNIAGTTRDFIREDIKIGENIFSLIDTAGIRTSSHGQAGTIETIGIEKAMKLISNAFYRILIINPFEFDQHYFLSVQHICFDEVIITHSDRDGFQNALDDLYKMVPRLFKTGNGPIEPNDTGPIEPKDAGPIEPKDTGPIEPKDTGPIEPIFCNLLAEDRSVLHISCEKINDKYLNLLSFDPVLIQRHAVSIKNIYTCFLEYQINFIGETDMALVASELNSLGHCISELLGIVSVDDVLHNIFNNFCIGK